MSIVREPTDTTKVSAPPVVEKTADLHNITIEERTSPAYWTVIVTREGRHLASCQYKVADGSLLCDLGVSGYMAVEDMEIMRYAVDLVIKKCLEWKEAVK